MSKSRELLKNWLDLATDMYTHFPIELIGEFGMSYKKLKKRTQDHLDDIFVDVVFISAEDKAMAISFFSTYYSIMFISSQNLVENSGWDIASRLPKKEATLLGVALTENKISYKVNPSKIS